MRRRQNAGSPSRGSIADSITALASAQQGVMRRDQLRQN
jgi:hypothetical protein